MKQTAETISDETRRAIIVFQQVMILERRLDYAQKRLNDLTLSIPLDELEYYHERTSKLYAK